MKRILLALAFAFLAANLAHATTRTWANTGTDFNTAANWGGTLPGTADIATFATAATIQPNLSSGISIAGFNFSTATSNGYDLTGSPLTLLSISGTAALGAINSAITSGTNTIDAALVLGAAAASTQLVTQSAGGTLVLNGVISSTNSITLKLGSTGNFNLNAANTYTGTTLINAGSTVLIGNKAAFGVSTISVGSNSTNLQAGLDLTGANKLSNAITWGANGTIVNSGSFGIELGGNVDLGGAARTMNLAISGGATFDGVISNDAGGGLVIATSNANLVALKGTNTYTGTTSITGTGKVSVSVIGNSGSTGGIGAGTTVSFGSGGGTAAGTLQYTGAGETTNRAILLATTSSTGGGIDASGSGALIFNGTFANTLGTTNNKTFTLSGSSTAANEIQGVIGDGVVTTGITKSGAGTWVLSGANTYSGITTISGGILSVASLANGGTASNLGQSASTSTNLVINGGTLKYTGATASTDRLFKIGTTTAGGSATIDASGSGALTFANTGALTYGSADQTRFLTLTGSNTGSNTFAALIADNVVVTGLTSNLVALTKSGAGTWVVSGANTYTGGTTINAGTLKLGAANALSSGTLTFNGGALAMNGFNQTSGTLAVISNAILDFSNLAAALIFGDSSALTWSGTLTVTNYNSANDSLHFGSSSSGLTAGQLSSLVFAGYGNVGGQIDANGLVTPIAIPEPSTYVAIFGAAALAGVILRRKQRSIRL